MYIRQVAISLCRSLGFLTEANFSERRFYALGRITSGIVPPMISGSFLSTASVVVLLVGVALLAVAGAVTLVPFTRLERRRGPRFLVCLGGIWAVAVLVITLIERTIG